MSMWIDNIKDAPKMMTVQLSAAAIALGSIPPEAQAAMLDAVGVPASRVPAILGALMLFVRLLGQKSVR